MRFRAAVSRRLTAIRTASTFSGVPAVSFAAFTRERNSLRTALFRSLALALVRMRFF